MNNIEELNEIKKESQLWIKSLNTTLTELMAIKGSIREIYNINNRVAGKLIPFESSVNNQIVKNKDLTAKIKIQEDESIYVSESRPERLEQFKVGMNKLKAELKKLHIEHLDLMDRFFNDIIL